MRAHVCDVTAVFALVNVNEKVCWAVSGQAWTLDQGLEIAFPEWSDFASWGTLSLGEGYLDLHSLVVSKKDSRSVLDKHYRFALNTIPSCLSEMVIDFGQAMLGRQLADDEICRVKQWGTDNAAAYLSLLRGWFLSVACHVALEGGTPADVNACFDQVDRLDPEFSKFRHEITSRLSPIPKHPSVIDPQFYKTIFSPRTGFTARS
ncbi:MAG: hypothetical protein ACO1RA_01880 [Planctomycetaceae bacterium]